MADRKKYTPQFRQELARLVIDTGQPIAQAARRLCVASRGRQE